jgi:hypothetical protein
MLISMNYRRVTSMKRGKNTRPTIIKRIPLELYRKHWQELFEKYGHITKRSIDTATDSSGFAKDDRAVVVGYELTFEKISQHPFYYVVKDTDGGERINLSGVIHSSGTFRPVLDEQPW